MLSRRESLVSYVRIEGVEIHVLRSVRELIFRHQKKNDVTGMNCGWHFKII
jgi:hypothetical protein